MGSNSWFIIGITSTFHLSFNIGIKLSRYVGKTFKRLLYSKLIVGEGKGLPYGWEQQSCKMQFLPTKSNNLASRITVLNKIIHILMPFFSHFYLFFFQTTLFQPDEISQKRKARISNDVWFPMVNAKFTVRNNLCYLISFTLYWQLH